MNKEYKSKLQVKVILQSITAPEIMASPLMAQV